MFAAAMDASALVMSVFSPTKTCRVRLAGSRYRYDPYRARVIPSPFATYHNSAHATTSFAAAPVAPATRTSVFSDAPIKPLTPAISPQKALKKTLADVVAAHAVATTTVVSPKKKSAAVAPKVAAVAAAPAAAPPAVKPQEHWVLVGFKHEAAMYQAPFRVAIGDVVVVEADRGEHIGVVQTITTTAPKYNVPSKVVRHASSVEIAMIDELTEKEAKITATTQRFADNFGLSSCRIVDTEMQMDGNKLTVFFASKVFVDFRKLQRSLFREFRCRIWLVNWNEVCAYTPVPVNAAPAL